MNDHAAELALIRQTMQFFLDGAHDVPTEDMTTLMGSLIESLVLTLAGNTDPDTALVILSQIIMRLAPRCERGTVTVFHDAHNPMGTKQ